MGISMWHIYAMGIWDNISLVENGDSPKKESDRIGFLFGV